MAGTLAAAALAAGCGESDEDKADEYRDGLEEAHQSFARELRDTGGVLNAAARAKSPARYKDGADQLQAAADDFKEELDGLEPPSDAEDEEEKVNTALDDFSEAIGRISEAVQSRDTPAIQAEQTRVRVQGAAVDRAIADLKRAVD